MHEKLTNLLPLSRQEALAREYLFRFGVVASGFFTVLMLVAALMLVPTYVFLAGNASMKAADLVRLKSTLSSADEQALSVRLAALSSDAAALIALSGNTSVSSVMRETLAVSRPGVTLASLAYLSTATKNTLALTGTAATRDALRSYQLALQGAPFVRTADLPVSAYAKDTNISFTITITLAP